MPLWRWSWLYQCTNALAHCRAAGKSLKPSRAGNSGRAVLGRTEQALDEGIRRRSPEAGSTKGGSCASAACPSRRSSTDVRLSITGTLDRPLRPRLTADVVEQQSAKVRQHDPAQRVAPPWELLVNTHQVGREVTLFGAGVARIRLSIQLATLESGFFASRRNWL